MFERFTKDARAVVSGAIVRCREAGAGTVTPEHLLLAVLDGEEGPAARALGRIGVTGRRDSVARAVEEAERRAGLSKADADALAEFGIDVTEIVSRVEETHGVGALNAASAGGAGGRPGRAGAPSRGPRPHFSQGARQTVEKSLRIALSRRERHVGAEHILLALLVRPGTAAEVMADHGVTFTEVERLLSTSAGSS